MVHMLAVHAGVAFGSAHAVPHEPQLVTLVVTLTHVAPHIIEGAVQVGEHAPMRQVLPAVQTLPQEPQLLLSA